MQKTWMLKSLLLSLPLLTLGACQEKIAPELSEAGSAATTAGSGGGGSTSSSELNFTLTLNKTPTNVEPDLLGYTLHKANSVVTSECKISDVTDVPASLDSTRDITCFLEAEEFALFFNGFKADISTDAEACDYITVTPFSYYKRMPGVSARMDGTPRQVAYFDCTANARATFGSVAMATTYGTNTSGFTTLNQMCGKYFNIDDDGVTAPEDVDFGLLNLGLTSRPVTAAQVTDMCSFNYKSGSTETKCDEGQIIVHTVSVDMVDPDPVVVGDELQTVVSGGQTLTKCGGNVLACVGGPAVDYVKTGEGGDYLKGTKGLIYAFNSQAGTASLEVGRSYLKRSSNLYAANFLRQCSGLPNFTTNANFNTLLTGYDASVIEEYSTLSTTLPGVQEKDEETGQLDVIILADDPFRAGIDPASLTSGDERAAWSRSLIGVNPQYVFQCLDKAYDVKARIRLSVREWNRNFSPTTQEFRYISDIFSATSRMDATGTQTNPANVYNDLADWDDFLSFTNSATNSCATSGITPLLRRTTAAFPADDEITTP